MHRDVSPQNVLVSTKGVAKLIDFGIAKARDRVAGDTNAETLKGKVRYMAPEQAQGHAVDRRADVWAVGAIMYHLLAGKPPFDGDNDMQTLLLLTSGRPPPPLPQTVHPAVAAVVGRALDGPARPSLRDRRRDAGGDSGRDAGGQDDLERHGHRVVPCRPRRGGGPQAQGGHRAGHEGRHGPRKVRRDDAVQRPDDGGPFVDGRLGAGFGADRGDGGGTLGSAAMDVAAADQSRKRALLLAGVGGTLLVGLAGFVVATRLPSMSSGPAPSAAAARPSATAATAPTRASVPEPGSSVTTVDLQNLPPVIVAATDLPQASPAPSASASASASTSPGRPGVRPPGPRPGHRRVDDGF